MSKVTQVISGRARTVFQFCLILKTMLQIPLLDLGALFLGKLGGVLKFKCS